MIKTYEVHDGEEEDDDEILEFDPQVVENLSWWQRCFVPKYPVNYPVNERHNGEDVFSESAIPTPTQQKGDVDEERTVEESRGRCYSEDVTVSTNLTTPPGTPDITQVVSVSTPLQNAYHNNISSISNISSNNNSSHNPSNSDDLETPSIRNVISAIDEEESEEAGKSSEEDREHDEVVVGTTISSSK